MTRVEHDPVLADLAHLEVLTGASGVGAEGLAWAFVDEVLYAMRDHAWDAPTAIWAVLASRARRAGLRDAMDIDLMAQRVLEKLSRTSRALSGSRREAQVTSSGP